MNRFTSANRISTIGGRPPCILVDGENNYLLNNDARYNFEVDCADDTGPGGPGTEGTYNTWENNFGFNNNPEEICIDTGGPF